MVHIISRNYTHASNTEFSGKKARSFNPALLPDGLQMYSHYAHVISHMPAYSYTAISLIYVRLPAQMRANILWAINSCHIIYARHSCDLFHKTAKAPTIMAATPPCTLRMFAPLDGAVAAFEVADALVLLDVELALVAAAELDELDPVELLLVD